MTAWFPPKPFLNAEPLKLFVNDLSILILSTFNRSNVSQVVTLILDSKPTSVLCHMGDFGYGCGDGGWTPVMKIDGSKVLRAFTSEP